MRVAKLQEWAFMSSTPQSRPRVSIIMRTLSRPRLLDRAIRDVFGQTYRDVELIIVDESDDPKPVAEIVENLSREERAKVTVVSRANRDHGRWLAANAGVRAAQGELVVLHDDDDLWHPEFLTATVAELDSDPATVAACVRTEIIIERLDSDGRLHRTDSYPFLPNLVAITLPDMLRANRVPPISLLYRRALHHELGLYDESLNVLGDWDFYIRVLARYPIELVDAKLAYWSHRPEELGHAANSIAAHDVRQVTDARIRDGLVRAGVQSTGLSPYMHIASEVSWLRAAIASDLEAVEKRTRSAEERIQTRIDELHRTLAALDVALHERTSIGHRIRALIRRRKT